MIQQTGTRWKNYANGGAEDLLFYFFLFYFFI